MDHLIPWLALKDVPGIGNHLYKRLIHRFGDPERVFNAPDALLLEVPGLSEKVLRALHAPKDTEGICRELERVETGGFQIITLGDPAYPDLLTQIPDPPPVLYVHGALAGSSLNLAVVGSRNATAYGIEITRDLCRSLVFHGLTVVSGLARGVDTAAHEGALSGKGKTIAVLGSGLARIYPVENANLARRIAENGAVVSEFPLDAEPDAHHFPQRNRIISGMSLGVVVMEATKNSGSLITAKLAADQGREVFAVPGSIHSHKSTGTHTLIKQGAKLVENAMDILEEFPRLFRENPKGLSPPSPEDDNQGLTEAEKKVLGALGAYPVHIDVLIRQTALDPGTLSGALLQLELAGRIRQAPGKFFCRSGHSSSYGV